MTYIWNENLHGQRVSRSNKHRQNQFLHPDHWIQIPKSRECDKHIWFVVRLRIGPVAASLNRLTDLLLRTIAASHSTTKTCGHLDSQSKNNNTFAFEEAHTDGMCPKIKGHVPLTSDHQFGSIKHHLDLFTLILWDTNINPENMNITSFGDSTHLTYITKISSWMPPTIGHLLENVLYGMPQLQHYKFGWQISNLTSSLMP